jgi:hypothetical protein
MAPKLYITQCYTKHKQDLPVLKVNSFLGTIRDLKLHKQKSHHSSQSYRQQWRPHSGHESRINTEIRYNNVSNQQDATTFLFKSALHVSDDKFAHPQERFSTVYTAFGIMHPHCCRPVPLWDGTPMEVPSQPWHRSAAVSVHYNKSCIYSPKALLRMGEFVARNR